MTSTSIHTIIRAMFLISRLCRSQAATGLPPSMAAHLAEHILLPCLVWRSGRPSATIRAMCIQILAGFFAHRVMDDGDVLTLLQVLCLLLCCACALLRCLVLSS